MKTLISIICFLFLASSGIAQDWNWPRDKQTAQNKWMYSSDMLKAKEYKEATKPLGWLLKNTPDLSEALYINASKIYRGMVREAEDPQRKKVLQDSVLLMYDLRMKHFNDSANVLNRKGIWAGYYLRSREGNLKRLYKTFNKIIALNGNKTYAYNIKVFTDVACNYQQKNEGISEDSLMRDYAKIGNIISHNLKNSSEKEDWEEANEKFRESIGECLEKPCAFFRKQYAPGFASDPDTNLAETIFSLTSDAGCYDSLYIAVSQYLIDKKKDYNIAAELAENFAGQDKTEQAIKYWKKAAELAGKPENKGNAYYKLAKIYSDKGQKNTSRSYARKAANTGTYTSKAYNLIGNLYYTSYEQCKGSNVVKSRAVFIAAYNMYKKAGNNKMMEECKTQFPSMGEIHTYGEEPGGKINTGCWINETVTIKKR